MWCLARRMVPVAVSVLLGALGALSVRAQVSPPVEIPIRLDQVRGPFRAERIANASVDALHGQHGSELGEAALSWMRVSQAVGFVRCSTWLGEGSLQRRPEWLTGTLFFQPPAPLPAGAPTAANRWEGMERVLDGLVLSGVRPFISCGGLPEAFLEGTPRRNDAGAAVNAPQDYKRYQEFMTQMFRRLLRVYGEDEVRSWRFEVWSQPDHEGSWAGGRAAPFEGEPGPGQVERFLRLYDHFAAAADAVDPQIPIGGPGIAGDPRFLRRFLEHCARGTNFATGKTGARIQFVSWHAFGSVEQILRRNEEFRAIAEAALPGRKDLEFVASDTISGGGAGDAPNQVGEASRLAALLDGTLRSPRGADLIFRRGDLAADHFEGERPLVVRVGRNTVPTPAFRLFQLLTRMGPVRVAAEPGGDGVGAVVARTSPRLPGTSMQALLYRRRGADKADLPVRLRVSGFPARVVSLPLRVYQIDASHLAPYEAWVAEGKPRPAPDALGAKLAGTVPLPFLREEPLIRVEGGAATVDVVLPPGGVTLVILGAEPQPAKVESERRRRLEKAEEAFSGALDLQQRRSFPPAVDALRKVQKDFADTAWAEAALQNLVLLYELDLKSPEQADAIRRELLSLPLDPITRTRVLERLRVDAVRKADSRRIRELTATIQAIEARLTALRRWDLRRYEGDSAAAAADGENPRTARIVK